jgi:hypothetical protein
MAIDTSNITPELVAKASFPYFFTRVLKYQWAPHMKEWQWLIENNKRFLLQCSRGHGKTIFLTAYCLWLVYRGDPVEILFFSHSEEQVKLNIMNKLDEIVMKNDYLAHLRPSTKQLWGSQLKTFITGAIVRGESFGSSTRGAHPDYIFEDDPLKDKGGMSPEEQHNYHMTVISGMAKRNTVIGVIGTPLDNGDLLEQLEKNPAYCFKAYPALNEQGQPLFPYLFTKEDLSAKEAEIGSFAFSREFLLKRIDSKSQIFKDQYRTINDKYEFPEFNHVRLLVDPAISEKEAACDSALVVVGITNDSHRYELETVLKHSDNPKLVLDEIIRISKPLAKKYSDFAIVIEAEVFQKVLAYDLRQQILEQHLDIRVIEVTHAGNTGKQQRIVGLQSAWESRAIHLLPDSPLIGQFRYYRPNIKGFKIDGIDAFSMVRMEDVSVPMGEATVIDEGVPPDAWN